EQVLLNKSRIPARITLLKPISAAISIGTGGPFGAEGPIIATGGAVGSLIGQLLHTTAAERKTLLAAGAAAGMTATFGSPVSAVLLAVELLLFELRPRSLIPVALAAAAAAAVRIAFVGVPPAVPLLVDLARQRDLGRHARAALHHRRRARRAARRGRRARFPASRHRPAHRGAGRHGGDVRGRLSRAPHLGGVRVRDHPAADG